MSNIHCETTGQPADECGCGVCTKRRSKQRSFSPVHLSDVEITEPEFLVPNLFMKGKLHVLIGEEGIGKGLWCAHIIARLTQQGHRVLYINGEDDPRDTLTPRLAAADAELSRVRVLYTDPETLVGVPKVPGDITAIRGDIIEGESELLLIDPWISIVDGKFAIKDPQRAREVLDPLSRLAAQEQIPVVLVVHPNRGEGSMRDRVGLTSVLRQAARVAIWVLEDPSDDAFIYVGVEKANGLARKPATRYRKQPVDPDRPEGTWMVVDPQSTVLTISEWDEHFRTMNDGRKTDRWDDVEGLAASQGGRISRQQVIEVYEKAGSSNPAKAADGSIARWTHGDLPRMRRITDEPGMFEVPEWLS